MLIRLGLVRRQPFDWDETVTVQPEELDREELLALGPVRWQGRVTYTDPGFFLRARLDYEQTLRCDRCLAPIVEKAGGGVESLLLVQEEPRKAGESELREEDLGVLYLSGEEFDARPLLVEQLQLGIPMKPLCREDCRGLCLRCGADLNQGPCGCIEQPTDPRWASLAALRDRLPDG